jgi:hypothetical protein
MIEPAPLLWVVLAAVGVFVAVMLEWSHSQIETDEEAEQPRLIGFKQSEHYQATWARVREYIDGWKHVNNGR